MFECALIGKADTQFNKYRYMYLMIVFGVVNNSYEKATCTCTCRAKLKKNIAENLQAIAGLPTSQCEKP